MFVSHFSISGLKLILKFVIRTIEGVTTTETVSTTTIAEPTTGEPTTTTEATTTTVITTTPESTTSTQETTSVTSTTPAPSTTATPETTGNGLTDISFGSICQIEMIDFKDAYKNIVYNAYSRMMSNTVAYLRGGGGQGGADCPPP